MFKPFKSFSRHGFRACSFVHRAVSFGTMLLLVFASFASLSRPADTDAQTPEPSSANLPLAVQSVAGAAIGVDPASVIIEVVEQIEDWAFGTSAAPATGSGAPAVKFFLAQRTDNGWHVTLRFTADFDAMLASAPPTFPSGNIRNQIDPSIQLAGEDYSQLSFPFPEGETWHFWGPHGDTALEALDFTAGDTSVDDPVGTVVAMRTGSVYRPCDGMVMIDHGDGWTTGYYHVDPILVSNGDQIGRGQPIGSTSTNYACGGFAASNHVHVWTEFRGELMPFAGQDIGGWTVENGSDIYFGCLVRESDRRCRLADGNWNNFVTNTGELGSGGTATVQFSLTSGQVGDEREFALDDYPPNTPVDISWRRPGGSVVDLGQVTTSALGTANGYIAIPATEYGDDNRVSFTSGSVTRTVRIAVYPNLTVEPDSVQPGTSVNLTISGFPKKSHVELSTAVEDSQSISLGSIQANNTGGGSLTITFPNGLPNGLGGIHAIVDGGPNASAGIEVSGNTGGHPQGSVSPTRNTVNNWLDVSVTDFPPVSTVNIRWIRPSGGWSEVGTLTTDASGQASGHIRVPATPGGGNVIWFVSGNSEAMVPFEVAPRIKIIPGEAAAGDTVDVSLRGFGKKEVVRIRWKQDNGWVELDQVLTSNTGSANVMIAVPEWVEEGPTSVRGDGTSFRAQTNAVTITQGGNVNLAGEPASPTPEATSTPEPEPTLEPTLESGTPEPDLDDPPAEPTVDPGPPSPTPEPSPSEESDPTATPPSSDS